MDFVVLLVSYFLQQKMDLPLSIRFDQAVLKILRPDHFSLMVKNKSMALLLLLLILSASFSIVYVVFFFIESTFWGIPSLLLQVAILLMLLGQKGFKENIETYLSAWKHGDFEAASYKQQPLTGINAHLLRDPIMMQNEVSKSLLYHNFNRFFVIAFWFMIAGPAAAIVVRVLDMIAQHSSHQLKRITLKVNALIEWVPARLLALSFAFTGDFKRSILRCLDYCVDFSTETPAVLGNVASSTLDSFELCEKAGAEMERNTLISTGVSGIQGIRELLNRSMALWLGVFAIVVILA